MDWLKIAFENHFLLSSYPIAIAYERGLGVEKDLKNALHWYRLASNQGISEAKVQLGILLLKHFNQRHKALELWRQGSLLGNQRAKKLLFLNSSELK